MEYATIIEITFRNGERKIFNKDEWDDYRYDGKAISVMLKGAVIAIYNFEIVFSVELKK